MAPTAQTIQLMHSVIFWLIAAVATSVVMLVLIAPLGSSKKLGLGLTVIVPLATLGLYFYLGRPDLTQWHTRQELPPFIAASVEKLTQDTRDHPTDIQAWVLLGDVYGRLRRYDEADTMYRNAAQLDDKQPVYKAMVGQALVMQDGGAVGSEAIDWFMRAAQEPIARYYLALAKSQAGDWQGALADWQDLAKTAPNQQQALIAAKINDAKTALGLDEHGR